METKTLLTIKTDKKVKAEAQKTAEKLGLPLGTVVNAFLKQFVRDQAFTVSLAHMPSDYLEMILEDAEKDIATKISTSESFATGKEVGAYLRKQK